MSLGDHRAPFAALLALLLPLLCQAPVLASDEGGTCRAEDSSAGASTDTVEATRPGPWRQDAKRQSPRLRVPGTKTVAEEDARSTEGTPEGRWVRGYRPTTPEAQSALEAWKAAQAATLGTADLTGVANQPTSNYAANLLRGGRVDRVPDEAIEHTVRAERGSTSRSGASCATPSAARSKAWSRVPSASSPRTRAGRRRCGVASPRHSGGSTSSTRASVARKAASSAPCSRASTRCRTSAPSRPRPRNAS